MTPFHHQMNLGWIMKQIQWMRNVFFKHWSQPRIMSLTKVLDNFFSKDAVITISEKPAFTLEAVTSREIP